jgi:hypothetical protein
MVSAEVRRSDTGTVFYKFVLARAPKSCSREQEMVSGTCFYDQVALRRRAASGARAPRWFPNIERIEERRERE